MLHVPSAWKPYLAETLALPKVERLFERLAGLYASGAEIAPPEACVFRALEQTPPSAVRVVIVGQDPYHTPGVAQGLAFSVGQSDPLPPSLRNIFKELAADTGTTLRTAGDLSDWAAQGVLLLNTTLTVAHGHPKSHEGWGWEAVTDTVLSVCAEQPHPTVFMLWGALAIAKRNVILARAHRYPKHILTAAHPSPLSARRGFFGCRHFTQCNAFLTAQGCPEIKWA
jgi:uracil-DNA glycosylase